MALLRLVQGWLGRSSLGIGSVANSHLNSSSASRFVTISENYLGPFKLVKLQHQRPFLSDSHFIEDEEHSNQTKTSTFVPS